MAATRRITFADIPDDMIFHVFTFLEPVDLGRVPRVCKVWKALANEDELWKTHVMRAVGEVEETLEPDVGMWKYYFISTVWKRNFDAERHHPDITINTAAKTASVLPGTKDSGYKGCMVTPAFPKFGKTRLDFKVKFLDVNDNTDHVSIGIGNVKFNTTKNCPEGWNDTNSG